MRREVERLLEAGQTCGVPKTEGVCREILKRRQALWTFVHHEGWNRRTTRRSGPFVLACCGARGVLGRRVPQGSRFVEAMMTVVATLSNNTAISLIILRLRVRQLCGMRSAPSLLPIPKDLTKSVCPAA